jgi:hypothetical protein
MTDIEIAYRTLATFLHTHFMGEPKADDLKGLLRTAYQMRADMNEAIERAQKALAAADPTYSILLNK